MKTILGIDPGCTGAIASYDGEELLVWDMPFYEITKGKGKRKKVDFQALRNIIVGARADHAYLEHVWAQPGNGAAAAFTFGCAYAAAENALIASYCPHTLVLPQKWKKEMDCPKDKDASRMRASQLLPKFAHNWDKKKFHNRAEAALIALYGFKQ